MRRLTLEETELVSNSAKAEGERPQFFNASTQTSEEISQNFEAYLIVTPIATRSDTSSFLQTILDNDPNQIDIRQQLMFEFLDEELNDSIEAQRGYESLTEYYDLVRSSLASSIEGFEDVEETTLLQESLTSSMGDIVSVRDRHKLNSSIVSVLRRRLDNGRSATLTQEIRSWIRLLVEYD